LFSSQPFQVEDDLPHTSRRSV